MNKPSIDEPMSSDAVDSMLKVFRQRRKELAANLAQVLNETAEHIENGSFPVVEQALVECVGDVCEIETNYKQAVAQKGSRGRRRNGTTTQASTAR